MEPLEDIDLMESIGFMSGESMATHRSAEISDQQVWIELNTTGSTEQMTMIMEQVARVILNAQYQTAHDRVIAEMQIDHLEPLVTEDDILSAAVNISNKK
jgi:predicted thioesterase